MDDQVVVVAVAEDQDAPGWVAGRMLAFAASAVVPCVPVEEYLSDSVPFAG